jgi:hypothetical protein
MKTASTSATIMTRSDFHIERFRLRGSRVDISSTGEVAEASVPRPALLTTSFQREQLAGALYCRTAGCAVNSRCFCPPGLAGHGPSISLRTRQVKCSLLKSLRVKISD